MSGKLSAISQNEWLDVAPRGLCLRLRRAESYRVGDQSRVGLKFVGAEMDLASYEEQSQYLFPWLLRYPLHVRSHPRSLDG